MRILEVSYKDPECHCGGVEDFILNLIVNMSSMGHQITCLYSQDSYPNTSGADYRKVNILPKKKPVGPILSLLYKITYNVGVLLYVIKNRKQIDGIHINGDNGVLLAPFFGRESVATFFGLPILRVRDTFSDSKSLKKYPLLLLSVIYTLLHFSSLLYSRVVVADNPQILGILRRFRKPDEVKLVYNSVDTKSFKQIKTEDKLLLRKELKLDPAGIYAIWIGNDAKGYGQDVAFSIALKHKDKLRLISVGAHSNIESGNIIQLGRIDHKTLSKYFGASDFMIFPQRYPGISLSMVSAMVSGLKVVTFSKYLKDFFTDDNTIFADSPNDMDHKVADILRNPKMLVTDNDTADPILKEFHPHYCAQRYIELFSDLKRVEHGEIHGIRT